MTDTGNGPLSPGQLLAMMPYAVTLGIELHEATPSLTTGSLAWAPERCTSGGILHGGAVISRTLHATARPAHVGRTLIVVTTDLTDDQQRLVAQTSQAQAVIT
jgi:1,4-dihydroxy-2-naphthoyl-CoA hydrolase